MFKEWFKARYVKLGFVSSEQELSEAFESGAMTERERLKARYNELRRALAFMVDNIGQPVSIETRDGFENAIAVLGRNSAISNAELTGASGAVAAKRPVE